jgi:hemolysin activation/secretion protein
MSMAQDDPSAAAQSPVRVIPPMAERPLDITEGDRIATTGFRVRGVTAVPELGISPASVQRLADGLYELIASDEPLSIDAALARAGERRAPSIAGLTVGQMQKVAEQIALHLRGAGLVLAQAYVPVQEVDVDGLITIDVMDAKLGKVVVEGAKRMPPSLIAASADPLQDGPLTKDRIESAMLSAQTLPGTAVLGTFRPGSNTGETDLVLKVQNEKTFEFRLGGDNYGTEFAGEYRARADAVVNNPSGFGDQLALTLLQAFHPTDTAFGSLRYSLNPGTPRTRVHLRAERAAFVADNQTFKVLGVEGDNETYEAGLRHDLRRTRTLTATSGLSLQARRADVKFKDISALKLDDDDLRVANLDFTAQRFDTRFKGVDFIDASVRFGRDQATDFEIVSNDERYHAVRLGYSRYQRLTDAQTLLLVARGQGSPDVLPSLERFSLGGPDSVRAYPVSEILSDRGILGSLEYRVGAPGFSTRPSPFRGTPWGQVLQFIAFYDYAWGELTAFEGSDEIHGVGGGLLFTGAGVNFKLTGATPQGSIDPSDDDNFRVYSEISVTF